MNERAITNVKKLLKGAEALERETVAAIDLLSVQVKEKVKAREPDWASISKLAGSLDTCVARLQNVRNLKDNYVKLIEELEATE